MQRTKEKAEDERESGIKAGVLPDALPPHICPQCGQFQGGRKWRLVAGVRRKLSPCSAQGAEYRHLQGVLTPGREKNERK